MASEKSGHRRNPYLEFYDENCRSIDFKTFQEVRDQVLEYLDDDQCPANVKSLFGTWLFRDLYMIYKIRGEEEKKVLCDQLEPAIEKIRDVVTKGAYLRYHDLEALSIIALYFYFQRFGSSRAGDEDKFFILQMLNDVQLIKGYLQNAGIKDSQLVEHFLEWIGRITVFEQRSNLLDVLLKYYPNDPRVKAVHQQMRFGSGCKKDLFSDEQNVHDEEIEEEVLCAATELYEWGADNPIADQDHPFPPGTTIADWARGKLYMVAKTKEDKSIVRCVLERCVIDTETFCLPETYEDPRPSFSIADIFYTTIHYLTLTPSPIDGLKILLAEMYKMGELCSSGYIARCITAIQGQYLKEGVGEGIGTEEDPICQIELSEEKSLHAILSYKIFSGLDKEEDPEISLGMIDPVYREKYVGYVCRVVNSCIVEIIREKGQKLNECVPRVMEKITDLKGWIYLDEILRMDDAFAEMENRNKDTDYVQQSNFENGFSVQSST